MDKTILKSWEKYIHNLDEAVALLNQQKTIAVGVAPYQRIIPSLFLERDNYQIYCVKNSEDVLVLRDYCDIYSLEEQHPEVAAKVHATSYLLKNYTFRDYLKNIDKKFQLLFYQTSPHIVEFLDQEHIAWIGNYPKTYEAIVHKDGFRALLKELSIPHLPSSSMTVPELLNKSYEELNNRWQGSVVIQPGDYEVSGGTFFVHNKEDFEIVVDKFFNDQRFTKVNTIKVTPFVTGNALSMLGCVTKKGIITGGLQLQLIDVPESLHGHPNTGCFFGHDWGFKNWSKETEQQAQDAVEKIGLWLADQGYKGIFGIDFIHDTAEDKVYPLECNPRFTGAIPVFSFLNILAGAPPIDFFTLAEFMNIDLDFDPKEVSKAWKNNIEGAHIALTPLGLTKMPVRIPAGIYSYKDEDRQLQYLRPGAFLHELQNKDEFIVIDQIPMEGEEVTQNVPRLFKLVFPVSIAEGTQKIKPKYAEILSGLSHLLRQ